MEAFGLGKCRENIKMSIFEGFALFQAVIWFPY